MPDAQTHDARIEALLEAVKARDNLNDVIARLLLEMSDATDCWASALQTDRYIVRRTTTGSDYVTDPRVIEAALDAGHLNDAEAADLMVAPKSKPRFQRARWKKLVKNRGGPLAALDERYTEVRPKPGPIVVENRATGEQIEEVSK
jgi:hypothetical protein